ncbi:MAG: class I tRNA ligase family protein, partial [Phormidesmis sp. CAN_BIN36]|nr:class I tRNA ligase family protein [Phormidesmis sp. CAN_BIN36]
EEEGVLGEIEEYKHTVPYSDRGKVPVEPLLSTQWFVKIKPLSEPALADLDQKNSPDFVPDRWGKVYRDWLVNLKDWCISRQLWWGHQIPAWYAVSETGGVITDTTPFMVARSEAEAKEKAIALFGENVQLEQDPDVLDTWFSSGLWPFSTLGWPDETPDFKRYYPTATLVTGFDIIFFWVARMTMMAKHFTGEMPFKTVYIHGLVRDENNKKMSKSSNNGIDPLILIDKYGTDALRYTLVREVTGAGQDIRLEYNRKTDESASVEASRNFTNKLWNASRFVLMNLDGKTPEQLGFPNKNQLELSDRWILSRFHQVTQQIRDQVDHYGLGESAKLLYEFIWGDFCDWYIELVKPRLQGEDTASRRVAQQTLAYVLEETLKLLHPFMPHITEEIWHTVTQNDETSGKTLALQVYPVPDSTLIDPDLEQRFELLIGTIRTIRNLRAEADIKPGIKIEAILQTESEQEEHILKSGQPYIQDLAKVQTLRINQPQTQPATESATSLSEGNLFSSIVPFLSKHQRILLTIGFILLTLIVLKACAGVLEAVHEIFLLPTFLELIGIGYTIWFTQQKLWKVDDRQQLLSQIEQLKQEVVGSHDLEPAIDVLPSVVEDSAQTIVGVVGTVRVAIPLAGLIDLVALRAKTEKDLKKVEVEIQSLSGRLSNAKFVDKAPADVVQTAKDALAEAQKQAEILQTRLDRLG